MLFCCVLALFLLVFFFFVCFFIYLVAPVRICLLHCESLHMLCSPSSLCVAIGWTLKYTLPKNHSAPEPRDLIHVFPACRLLILSIRQAQQASDRAPKVVTAVRSKIQ